MFEKIRDFFSGKAPLMVDAKGNPTSDDFKIATGLLLLEAAGGDQDIGPEEIEAIISTLSREFKLDEEQTSSVLEAAETLRSDRKRFEEIISAMSSLFTQEQKMRVLSMVWQVVKADGKVDRFEKEFTDVLAPRLGLSCEEALKVQRGVE